MKHLTPRQREVLLILAESPMRRIYPGPINPVSVILERSGRAIEGIKYIGASTAYGLMAAGLVDEDGYITNTGLRAAKILGPA